MPTPPPTQPRSLADQVTDGHRNTLLSQGLRLFCKAAGVIALARLASPTDHGLYAMAATVTILLWIFRDLGLGTVAIQAPHLDKSTCTALFWTHLGLGLLLTLLTLAAAPLAAWFYNEPGLTQLISAMSVSFLFIGIGGLPRTLLLRELRLAELNRAETTAAVLGTITMIVAAGFGAGAYAFVLFLLVSEFLAATLAWKFSRWIPAGPPKFRDLGELLRAGLQLTQYNALNFLSQQAEVVVIGQALGAHALGLYNRAGQLLNLPLQHVAEPLSQIGLSALSRCTSVSHEFSKRASTSANVIAYFTLPVAAFAIATPGPLIQIVLGSQWSDATTLLRWLAVSAAITYLSITAHVVAVAAGQAKKLALMALVTLPVIIASALAGLPHGVEGVVIAVALAQITLALPRLWWRLHKTPVTLTVYFSALRGPLVTACVLACGTLLGQTLTVSSGNVAQQGGPIIGALLALSLAGFVSVTLRHEWSSAWNQLSRARLSTTPPTSRETQTGAR